MKFFFKMYCYMIAVAVMMNQRAKRQDKLEQNKEQLVKAMKEDIVKLKKQNQSKEQIYNYFWSIDTFRAIWHVLDMNQKDLERIVSEH